MDLQSCRVFLSLIDTKSFSQTAELLYMSQPAVSQRIRQLEEEVGAALLVRTGHGLTLTDAGEAFYPYARILVETWDQSREEMGAFTTHVEGPVRVWASQTAGGYILPAVLCEFAHRHPAVSVRLQIGNSAQVEHAVHEGQADFGIVESPAVSGHLLARSWLDDELVCVCVPDHPLGQSEDPIPPDEADVWLFALREPGSGTRETLLAVWPKSGGPSRTIELGSLAAIRESVLTGRAVTFVSRWVVADDLARHRLVERQIRGVAPTRRMRLVRRRAPFPSRACALLFEEVLRAAQRVPLCTPA